MATEGIRGRVVWGNSSRFFEPRKGSSMAMVHLRVTPVVLAWLRRRPSSSAVKLMAPIDVQLLICRGGGHALLISQLWLQ